MKRIKRETRRRTGQIMIDSLDLSEGFESLAGYGCSKNTIEL